MAVDVLDASVTTVHSAERDGCQMSDRCKARRLEIGSQGLLELSRFMKMTKMYYFGLRYICLVSLLFKLDRFIPSTTSSFILKIYFKSQRETGLRSREGTTTADIYA